MVVKSQLKFIKSLHQKKYRIRHGLFMVEGSKMVQELLQSNLRIYKIYSTGVGDLGMEEDFVELVSAAELKKMSALNTPNSVLGIFHIPKAAEIVYTDWVIALDNVRDPGNLGTIIRLCDWYGIGHLVCSPGTVDCYNPKVLQATMGSIARVNIVYAELKEVIAKVQMPIYGAFMEGIQVGGEKFPEAGILVLGNEANGISENVTHLVDKKISIPQFGQKTAESLNVAIATGILLNEIRRTS